MNIIRLKEGEVLDFTETDNYSDCLLVPFDFDADEDPTGAESTYACHYIGSSPGAGYNSLPDSISRVILRLWAANGKKVPQPTGGLATKALSMLDNIDEAVTKLHTKAARTSKPVRDKTQEEILATLKAVKEHVTNAEQNDNAAAPQKFGTDIAAVFGNNPTEVTMKFKE